MPQDWLRRIATVTGAALIAAGPGAAWSGGFALHERSAEAQGASFAGADSGGTDITFAGFNPAALGAVDSFAVGANLSLVWLDVDAEADNPLSGQRSHAGFADPIFAPALAFGYRLNEALVLGLTVNAQFGLETVYPNDATVWPAAGAGLTSRLTGVTATPLVAWNVAPKLTVAGGPAIHHFDGTLSRAVGAPGTQGSAFPEFPVGRLTGDTFEFGWQAGVLYEPREGTRLGLSYTSGFHLDIDGSFDGPAGKVPARAANGLPDVFGFGLRQSLGDDLTLMANARYFNWSRFDVIDIEVPAGYPNGSEVANYADAIFLGLGLEAGIGHGLTLRGGVAYDDSPVRDAFRSPRVPDADRFWISAGASYGLDSGVKLDLAYSLLIPEKSTVPANGVTVLTPVEYDGLIHILSVGASFAF